MKILSFLFILVIGFLTGPAIVTDSEEFDLQARCLESIERIGGEYDSEVYLSDCCLCDRAYNNCLSGGGEVDFCLDVLERCMCMVHDLCIDPE